MIVQLVRPLLLTVILSAVAVGPVLAMPSNKVLTNVWLPIPEGPLLNTCNGEDVLITGTQHLVISVTADEAGGFRYSVRANGIITGVGLTTGTRYRGAAAGTLHGSSTSGATTATFISHSTLAGQGAVPNPRVNIVIHTTINANGTATATVEKVRAQCSS